MQWVFATAIGQFCEAAVNYLANLDKASDKNITLSTFSSEVYPAFEIFSSNWLNSSSQKVRLATVAAMGSICQILPKEQFEGIVLKMVPALLSLYRKEKDTHQLAITQGMYSVLNQATKDGNMILQPQVNTLLLTYHALICSPVTPNHSKAQKNHNEMLRCVEALGKQILFF